TEHPDMLLGYELGGHLHRKRWKSVWKRGANDGGGVITGSGGAFLVMESRAHAEASGRPAYAQIDAAASGRARRDGANLAAAISGMLRALPDFAQTELVVSGASGAHIATGAERQALRENGNHAVRAFTSLTGHMKEAQFPFAVALA